MARGGEGGLLWEAQQQGIEALHAAIVGAVVASASASASGAGSDDEDAAEAGGGSEKGAPGPLLTDFFSSRALRRLVLAGADGSAGARAFVGALWDGALAGQCRAWVGGHAGKVLAALLACGEGRVEAAARKELGALVSGMSLDDWAAQFLGPPGGKAGGKRGREAQQPPAGQTPGKRQQAKPQQQQQKQQEASAGKAGARQAAGGAEAAAGGAKGSAKKKRKQ